MPAVLEERIPLAIVRLAHQYEFHLKANQKVQAV